MPYRVERQISRHKQSSDVGLWVDYIIPRPPILWAGTQGSTQGGSGGLFSLLLMGLL